MSTVDYSERDAEGKIIGPAKEVMILGSNYNSRIELARFIGMLVGVMSASPLMRDLPRMKPIVRHERHQGDKERARRLKKAQRS
jgi:hypothetical protein